MKTKRTLLLILLGVFFILDSNAQRINGSICYFAPKQQTHNSKKEIHPGARIIRAHNLSGIDKYNKANGFKIEPNPASEEITIYIPIELGKTQSKVKSIEVYDALGRLVIPFVDATSAENNIKINISTLEAGLYFVSLKYFNSKRVNQKFIKK